MKVYPKEYHLSRATFFKSSIHRATGCPTLRLPVSTLAHFGSSDHPFVWRHDRSHFYCNGLILRAKSVTLVLCRITSSRILSDWETPSIRSAHTNTSVGLLVGLTKVDVFLHNLDSSAVYGHGSRGYMPVMHEFRIRTNHPDCWTLLPAHAEILPE